VINHSELPIIFCSSNHISALLDNAVNCPSLKMIVSFDPLDASKKAEIDDKAKDRGIEVKEMSECASTSKLSVVLD
jgi:ACT domain-containing protein